MIENGTRGELTKKISRLVNQKSGDIEAYKEMMDTIWKYLRHVLGFMTSTLVMERAIHITNERFPDIHIDMTTNGPNFQELEDSTQNIEALRFCIDCVIEFMEKLAGDVLLKGLMRRLTHKKANEIP